MTISSVCAGRSAGRAIHVFPLSLLSPSLISPMVSVAWLHVTQIVALLHVTRTVALLHVTRIVALLHVTQTVALMHVTRPVALLHVTQTVALLHVTRIVALPHVTHIVALLYVTRSMALLHVTQTVDVHGYGALDVLQQTMDELYPDHREDVAVLDVGACTGFAGQRVR